MSRRRQKVSFNSSNATYTMTGGTIALVASDPIVDGVRDWKSVAFEIKTKGQAGHDGTAATFVITPKGGGETFAAANLGNPLFSDTGIICTASTDKYGFVQPVATISIMGSESQYVPPSHVVQHLLDGFAVSIVNGDTDKTLDIDVWMVIGT